MIYTHLQIDKTDYTDAKSIQVSRTISESNGTSNCSIRFDNTAGRNNDSFSLNDEILIDANQVQIPKNYWLLEDNKADTVVVNGGSANPNNGVLNGGRNTTNLSEAAVINNGFHFNGTTDQVNCGNHSSLDLIGTHTLSLWIYIDSYLGSFTDVMAKTGGTGGANDWSYMIQLLKGSKNARFTSQESDGGIIAVDTPTNSLLTGQWYHVCQVADGSFLRGYINGVLSGTPVAYDGTVISIDGSLYLGKSTRTVPGYFDGLIDEPAVFNFALTAEQVREIYNNGTGRTIDRKRIFLGKVEDISFSGSENTETVSISGRDYGLELQDRQVFPRIWKTTEISDIVKDIISQNAPGIGVVNVNLTTTTPDKITFNDVSCFDAIKQLGEMSGFIFYVDNDKDLHFEKRNSISSGFTFNNTNVWDAQFKSNDRDIFNKIVFRGNRVMTKQEDIFTANGGSVFQTSYKSHNLDLLLSGVPNAIYQPGGVFNFHDPADDNIKYLVDFQAQRFIMTSGTTAGNNLPISGTDVLIARYDKKVPILSIKSDVNSQLAYGLKEMIITDQRVEDPVEAALRANTILQEKKDPTIEGDLAIKGFFNLTPGNTAIVNLPWHNVDSQTYRIFSVDFSFNPENNRSERVQSIQLNKKKSDLIDSFKEQILRMRKLESTQGEPSLVLFRSDLGSIGISGPWKAIRTDIGDAFIFHHPIHGILNSPVSLLAKVEGGGSITFSGGY